MELGPASSYTDCISARRGQPSWLASAAPPSGAFSQAADRHQDAWAVRRVAGRDRANPRARALAQTPLGVLGPVREGPAGGRSPCSAALRHGKRLGGDADKAGVVCFRSWSERSGPRGGSCLFAVFLLIGFLSALRVQLCSHGEGWRLVAPPSSAGR